MLLLLMLVHGYSLLQLPAKLRYSRFLLNKAPAMSRPSRSLYSSSSSTQSDTAQLAQNTSAVGCIPSEEYAYHRPVLLAECCDFLMASRTGGLYVDCTLGGGGHTREILKRGGSVIGLDQDSDAIRSSTALLGEFLAAGRLEIAQINFRHLEAYLQRSAIAGNRSVDGILLDLGISSYQINQATRGFAFGIDGPLDMRMSQDGSVASDGITAATIVNEYDAEAIADILYVYGDETKSRQIAREIVSARPLNSTQQLASVINRITPWKQRSQTLARCFQALRIVVNDEMRALDEILLSAHRCLGPKGRLVVISYHSLEDRKVKRLFKSGTVTTSSAEGRTFVDRDSADANPWQCVFKGAQLPSAEELEANSRSRSAKLRVAEVCVEDALDERAKLTPTKASFMGAKQLLKRARILTDTGDDK